MIKLANILPPETPPALLRDISKGKAKSQLSFISFTEENKPIKAFAPLNMDILTTRLDTLKPRVYTFKVYEKDSLRVRVFFQVKEEAKRKMVEIISQTLKQGE